MWVLIVILLIANGQPLLPLGQMYSSLEDCNKVKDWYKAEGRTLIEQKIEKTVSGFAAVCLKIEVDKKVDEGVDTGADERRKMKWKNTPVVEVKNFPEDPRPSFFGLTRI